MSEKEMMAKIIREDLGLINAEVTKQFQVLWEKCRADLEHEMGIDQKQAEIAQVEAQIEKLKEKVGELQSKIQEYNNHPTAKDYVEAGIEPPQNRNGYIYSHDQKYMGVAITSIMDLLIVKRIKTLCDPERPLLMLSEIAQSAYRALIMAGTYDEARKAYESFYNLDFRRFGVKIPRRLDEIKKVEGKNLMSATVVPALPAPKANPPEEESKKV
jgi:hypothetical protein